MLGTGVGWSFIRVVAILAVAYFLAGTLGALLAPMPASSTALWPATGIAVAAFILLGHRVWPGIVLGAFAVNLTTAGSMPSSLGIAAGNTLEALLAAYLVNRFANGAHAFERATDVVKYALLAAVASPVVGATIGVTSLSLTGFAAWSDFMPVWLTWWLGDTAGVLVLSPALILWADPPPRRVERARVLEAAGLFLWLVLTGLAMFGGLNPISANHNSIQFLTFPVLIWAALRFGPRESATVIVVFAAMAIWGTHRGFGPFVREIPNESLVVMQAFMGVASITSLVLAAAVTRAEERVRATEERLHHIEEGKASARAEFLSVAAHELRTPMTGSQIAVQFLLRQLDRGAVIDPDQLRRALRAVDDQSAKLSRLVGQLLDTASVQARRFELDLKVEDVASLVAGAVKRAQATTTRHVFVLSAPERASALVDADRLEQVLRNLLDNAIKFSPFGGRIEVELAMTGPETMRLAVQDRGIGIPTDRRSHVFDGSYQAHTNADGSGLGLGLYLSRKIIELHGGRIEAEFPEGGGTRVVLHFPTHISTALGLEVPHSVN